MKWIDLFEFLNKQANNLNAFGKFDWQSEVKVYDNAYGGLFNADLIEFIESGNKETYFQIDSGDN